MPKLGQDTDTHFSIITDKGAETPLIAKDVDPGVDIFYRGLKAQATGTGTGAPDSADAGDSGDTGDSAGLAPSGPTDAPGVDAAPPAPQETAPPGMPGAGTPPPGDTSTATGNEAPPQGAGTPPPGPPPGPVNPDVAAPQSAEGNGARSAAPDAPQANLPYARPQMTQTNTTSNTSVNDKQAAPDFQQSVDDYKTSEMAALNEEAKLHAQRAQQEANVIGANNQKYAAFEQQKQAEVQRRMTEINDVEQRFKGMRIDGGRFFGDGVTSSKVFAGIGLALGALGTAYSGKDYVSQVQKTIENAIDRDIDVQKANINKAGKEVEMSRGGLRDYLDTSKDMEVAINMEKARQLEAVGKQFEQIAAANPSAAIQAKAQASALPFQEKASQLRMNAGQTVHSTVTQNMLVPYQQQRPEDVADVNKNFAIKAKVEKLQDAMDSGLLNSGPISGRIAKVKSKFGFDDVQANKYLNDIQNIANTLKTDMASARGLSSNYADAFADVGPDITQSPQKLKGVLGNIHDDLENSIHQSIAANNSQFRTPMDYDTLQNNTYKYIYPEKYNRQFGVTPSAATAPGKKRHK